MWRNSMSRYRFLSSSRWIGLLVGTLVVSAVCTVLGMWQWGRYEQKVEQIEQIDANYGAEPVPLEDFLSGGLTVEGEDQWRRVVLTGEFVPESSVALRNRPVDGIAALHTLAVFLAQTDGGRLAVVVDRGWVGPDDALPALPSGETTLVVRLRPEEGPVDRTAPPGQAYTVHVAQVIESAGSDLDDVPALRGYGQDTAPAAPLRGYPEPERTLGSHLSYAFQWWFFALAAPVGVAILARREAHEDALLAGPDRASRPVAPGLPASRRRRGRAEREEDALIEAQL